jgi:hypothetical protein
LHIRENARKHHRERQPAKKNARARFRADDDDDEEEEEEKTI